jgi:hypothetical protein
MPGRSRGRSHTKRDILVFQVEVWAQGQLPSPGKSVNAKKSQPSNAGLINGGRFERVDRNNKLMINIATWNIMTMLKPGKTHEKADQMLKTRLQIIALQEIRWKGSDQIKKYSLYYCCSQ